MSNSSLKTPCIGLCSTVYGDAVCRGCKRYDYEIIDWNIYDNAKQQAVWHRLERLLAQVMSSKLIITDKDQLKEKLIKHNIRFKEEQSEFYWALLLLQKGSRLIKNMDAYGIELIPPYNQIPLWELREQIDKDFFDISTQNYPT